MSDEQNPHERLAYSRGFKPLKKKPRTLKNGDRFRYKGVEYKVVPVNGKPTLVQAVLKRIHGDG